ncbi:MAG: hypothetical protein K0B15_15400 [Lentimicrobium sp.]|nr:hypothetical protein [Lentimicrobium sp.]
MKSPGIKEFLTFAKQTRGAGQARGCVAIRNLNSSRLFNDNYFYYLLEEM